MTTIQLRREHLEAMIAHAREAAPAVHHHFSHGEMERESGTVLPFAEDLPAETDDSLLAGGAIVLEIAIVPFVVRARHEHIDVVPDDLTGGIPEQTFRRWIERLDQAVVVDGDDSFHRALDDRAQASFAPAQRGFDFKSSVLGGVSHWREV